MRITFFHPILIIFLSLWGGCESKKPSEDENGLPDTEFRQLLDDRHRAMRALVTKDDAAGLARLYTPQARLAPPDSPHFLGRETIQSWWQSHLQYAKDQRRETLTVNGNEFMLYETGKLYTHYVAHDSASVWIVDKYAYIWRKQSDGTYLLDVDMWNANRPNRIKAEKIPYNAR